MIPVLPFVLLIASSCSAFHRRQGGPGRRTRALGSGAYMAREGSIHEDGPAGGGQQAVPAERSGKRAPRPAASEARGRPRAPPPRTPMAPATRRGAPHKAEIGRRRALRAAENPERHAAEHEAGMALRSQERAGPGHWARTGSRPLSVRGKTADKRVKWAEASTPKSCRTTTPNKCCEKCVSSMWSSSWPRTPMAQSQLRAPLNNRL